MKILLVNPYVSDFKLYDEWMKPIGLYHVAALLKQAGIAVDYINCLSRDNSDLPAEITASRENGTGKFYYEEIEKPALFADIPRKYKRYGIPVELLQKQLQKLAKPDVILVGSTMTYWYPGVNFTIQLLKDYFPQVPIGLGGIYARLCHQHAQKFSGADLVFGGVQGTGGIAQLFNWLHLQLPHSLDLPYDFNLERQQFIPLLLNRGCPYNCSYCAASYLNDHPLALDVNQVLDIIDGFYRQGITNICIYDDALLFDYERRLGAVITAITETFSKNIQFHTPNGLHARYVSRAVARDLYENGFKTLRLGFETADETTQQISGGKVNVTELKYAIDNLLAVGFKPRQIGIYVMAGLESDNLEEFRSTVQLCTHFQAKIMPVRYSPVPHTKRFKQLQTMYPIIVDEPLSHNDQYFSFMQLGIAEQEYEEIRNIARQHNATLA